jgi:hypothetical protein
MPLSKGEFNKVDVTEQFSESVTLESEMSETISSVTSDFLNEFVNISFSGTSLTVSGAYPTIMFGLNKVSHITRGSSDNYEKAEESPTFDMPKETRQVISYEPDPRSMRTVTYTITSNLGTPYTITQDVWNNYSTGRDTLKEFI